MKQIFSLIDYFELKRKRFIFKLIYNSFTMAYNFIQIQNRKIEARVTKLYSD